MQQPETHTIGDGGNGGGGKILGGGGGGGERRLRLHHHQGQALKCPRCDSTNTKFCYYNNYNFSQPRHFCKGCRRYWTKGGILRNVPVGGGCRKPKRSRPKKPSSAEAGPELESEPPRPKKPSCRSSSSESSSLTAPPPDPSSKLLKSGFFLPHSAPKPTPNFEPEAEMFAGIFSSLITDPAILAYSQEQSVRSDPSWHLQKPTSGAVVVDQELKVNEITGCLLDQPVQVEFPMVQNRSGTTGLWPPLDWHGVEEQSFCDLYGAVDQAYWSQNQWSTPGHHDHLLYLP